jgi:serine/threonine-protein kinase RsbW
MFEAVIVDCDAENFPMVRLKQDYQSNLQQLAAMRAFVRGACLQAGWQEKADNAPLIRLELALTEAMTNVIRHGYEGKDGQPIEMVVEADGEQAAILISHQGRCFDPESADIPPPTFDGSREGGFGLYMIKQCCDDVQYFEAEPGTRCIRLVKKRK